MKKVILGIVLFAQFIYGMEREFEPSESRSTNTTTLVSSRFFQESEARFRTHLESVLRSITEGSITPESAIVSIGSDHRESLVMLRSSLNQGYLNQLEEQRVAQEELIRRITSEKEHEIQALQERLDTLLHASGSTSESFRIFNQERRHAEENVRRARAQAEQGEIPELVTERQVDRTSRRFSEQLDEIKREVQESRRTLEEAFERTQEKYGDNIDALIGNLQDRYEDILAGVTTQYNERRERIEEAYEQQKALMQRMIDEVASINLKLEKEKELESRISHVFIANPYLKPEKVVIRSSDVDNIADIFLKHDTVQREYNKFAFFSELYGNTDLGVVATIDDLNAVKQYVNETVIAPLTAVEPPKRPYLVGTDHGWGNRGGDVEWNNGRRGGPDHGAWVNPALVGWLNRMGEDNFTKWWWNKYAPSWPGEQLNAAVGRAMSTYSSRLATYQSQKSRYEAQIKHALAQVFPSESFNRLVEQFNEFVSKLKI